MTWNTPENLKYTQNDEWVLIEGDTATIGVTDYAQDQLSDVVYVEASVSAGDTVAKEGAIATVESVKAASDVYAPAGGEVLEVNEALEDEPELVNSDPYGQGWMVKIKLSNAGELDGLMDAAAYAAHCDEREG